MPLLLFGPLGLPEILIIVVLIILIFGARKLPLIGAGLGKGIRNFKEEITNKENAVESGKEEDK